MRTRHVVCAAAIIAVAASMAWRYLMPVHATGMIALPDDVASHLEVGDLVFRQGSEPVSDAVRAIDTGEYSHVGMLVGSAGHWRVVHAVPAERTDRNDGVVEDSLDEFRSREHARRIVILRIAATPMQREAAAEWTETRLGTPFRIAGGGTYCTQLVWQAYRENGVDLDVRFQHLNLPLLEPGDYLLPSALLASPRVSRVYESPEG
ncbi:permuted papain-like amidase YaeF/Yiix C92 family enzyme [Luteibacter rhizovicinus]|uniref:Permuted papain-like amidase YaeF/Yiix C92 family enzyme n=1 Tax=Luteibacter rhizovicinus TaxID=242606 RepID=A0A4R3YT15_9GAMM|nr:YiiX/YebB-like N1pC/P60 family cysteine hydrolase [Luteibacter rhizovicinus]TCV96057.1 permuted papain-like amidase YaeF/Yiix C92 family enzyme [Luteibacter rhizovicinus]